MSRDRQFSRRLFLQSSAGAALLTGTARGINRPGANSRLQLAFIGVGTMGRGHLGTFLGYPDVQIVGVCDVVAARRDQARKMVEDHYAKEKGKGDYKGCAATVDFRELLDRKDVDAVVIATPDHWHAIPCVLAARARKHIYCEKPLTRTLGEGRKVVDAVRDAKIVFQTGSQQRSEYGLVFRRAAELVRNGRVGNIQTVRVGVGAPARPCDLPEQPTPEGTDWVRWLGPSPKRGFHEALCPKGVHSHFPAWREYREYAGGGLADMGAHHFDIAQWALDMDASGPVRIEPPAGDAKSGLKFTYANGIVMFHGGPSGCTFEGTEGTLYVDRGRIESKPESILKEPLGDNAVRVYHATDHRRNWLECVSSKRQTICPAEVGHRSASICHLANIGYQLRRPLRWDASREKFLEDDEANRLIDQPMREPWKL